MTNASLRNRWACYALCAVLTGILSFIVAHLPVQLQKPIITAIWLGGLIGVMVAWLAHTYAVRTSRRIIALAACLGVVASISVTGQRYWMYRQVKTEEYLGDLNEVRTSANNTPDVFSANTLPASNLREQFREEREAALERILPFDVYLQTRMTALYTSEKPSTKQIAIVFWTLEILLAGVASGSVSLITVRSMNSTETPA